MILQELNALYSRLLQEDGNQLPDLGFSTQLIGFRIVLKEDGTLVEIRDIREPSPTDKKPKPRAQKMIVPGGTKPSGSGLNPCFLWDNSGYLLGYKGADDKKPARTREAFAALRDKYLAFESRVGHPAFSAVCRFLESWNPELTPEKISDASLYTCNGVFRIQSSKKDVHTTPEIQDWWRREGNDAWSGKDSGSDGTNRGICLVSGKESNLALLHEPAIKGVWKAQVSGAKLVSFNCSAFTSYGKEQSLNAPVGEYAAFSYCNALNYLLGNENHSLQLGAASTVFWSDAPVSKMEEVNIVFRSMINTLPPAMDKSVSERVESILTALKQGRLDKGADPDDDVRFFILGLEANASRLSVPFWLVSSFGELRRLVQNHYENLSIVPRWTKENSKFPDPELPLPFDLLRQTCRESKDIPKPYVGALMRSILQGLPYSDAIAGAMLRRIRIDCDVNYLRASFLKAWLIRNKQHSITKMLNTDNEEPGYVIGRLFAVYVKTQEDAGLTSTVKSYFSSASMTPLLVMSRLARLNQHHLKKLPSEGHRVNREKLLGEIEDKIKTSMPRRFTLEQQALFTLGYYHQMNSFYQKKDTPSNSEQQPTA